MSKSTRDSWEQMLDKKHTELQSCQTEHSVSSCLKCPEMLDCKVRDSYVKSVYESMSKGHGGGFEF